MKDGYYLSAYAVIKPLSRVQFTEWRHDHNIALWKKTKNKIELVEYYELERYTGLKNHNAGFTSNAEAKNFINRLLYPRGLSLSDICEIWGTPITEPYPNLFLDKKYSYHSLCHLFSAILMDTEKFYNEKILGFAIDGAPDYYIDNADIEKKHYYCGCYSDKSKINMFPCNSPGVIWNIISKLFNMREGSLMALATASSSEFVCPPDPVIHPDKGIWSDNLLDYIFRLQRRLLGAIDECEVKTINYDKRFTITENLYSMSMKRVHEMSLAIMCENIEKSIKDYGIIPCETYLAMSGGCGLNCPTNSYLMNKYGFKGFIGPPCQNDSGQALGIGLYSFYKQMDKLDFNLKHAYYGYLDNQIDHTINEFADYIKSVETLSFEKAVDDICVGPVVWFNGRAEIGPRALGNRSILGDPRKEETKHILNKIKGRQWWRPVAPVILVDEAEMWFENADVSPFMLHTFNIKEEKIREVPAIVHIDTSARVQTINRDDNEALFDLISMYKNKTGIPILCNTSLNDKGEPIINTAREALNFALRKKMKIVYINMKRIELKNFENYKSDRPLTRDYEKLCKSIDKSKKLYENFINI